MITFEEWWKNKGSGMRPEPDEDMEKFAERIAAKAWSFAAEFADRPKGDQPQP